MSKLGRAFKAFGRGVTGGSTAETRAAKRRAFQERMGRERLERDAAFPDALKDRKFWLTYKEVIAFSLGIIVVFSPVVGVRGALPVLVVYWISYVFRLNSAIDKKAKDRQSTRANNDA